jgi:hypothetical protein
VRYVELPNPSPVGTIEPFSAVPHVGLVPRRGNDVVAHFETRELHFLAHEPDDMDNMHYALDEVVEYDTFCDGFWCC